MSVRARVYMCVCLCACVCMCVFMCGSVELGSESEYLEAAADKGTISIKGLSQQKQSEYLNQGTMSKQSSRSLPTEPGSK